MPLNLRKLNDKVKELEDEREDLEDEAEIEFEDEEEDTSNLMSDIYRRSEETAWHRWSTELEPHTEEDEFWKRHKNLIRSINKFAPLSYIVDKRVLNLIDLRLLKLRMLENIGLRYDAEEESLKILGTLQLTRGIRGFFTKALITQRRILYQGIASRRKESEGGGWFGTLLRRKKPEKIEAEEEVMI